VNVPEAYKSAFPSEQKLPPPQAPSLSKDAKSVAALLCDSEGGALATWLIVHNIAADLSFSFGAVSTVFYMFQKDLLKVL
jgi:hypothetical protein